jgi:3'(2'), 5'-bisphosphate nucleotidase
MNDQARLAAILEVMIDVALEAGRLVLPLFETGCASNTKSDGSIVTVADTKGEALIQARLSAAFPQYGFLGEEATSSGANPDLNGPYFCVDPIDGTKQFASGDPEWVIAIGFLEAGRPVAGVIYAPALNGRLFAGLADFGAFEQFQNKSRSPIHSAKLLPERLTILRGGHDSTASIISSLPSNLAYDMTKVSSALKFGLIATGEADLWIRVGRVYDWDIAAGQAIVEAAGGRVTYMENAPLIFGKESENFRHPPFIARCAALHDWPNGFQN